MCFAVATASPAFGQDPKRVMFHAAGEFAGADVFVSNHLTKDLQLDVTLRIAGEVEEGEYDTFDGIVFSPTNNSGDGRGKGIKTTTTPVFNWEDALYKDSEGDFYFQESGKNSVAGLGRAFYPNSITQIEITDESHPLAAGLGTGVHTIYRTPQAASWAAVDGFPAGGIGIGKLVAAEGDPEPENGGAWGVFAFETGAEVVDGTTTPARRVGFPAFEDSVSQFTPEGYRLFAASVSWMLGIEPPQDGDVNVDGQANLEDFSVIADNFLTGEYAPGTRADGYTPENFRWRDQGDVNWDRIVDFQDFGQWKLASAANAGGAVAAANVPEPGTWGLLVMASIAALCGCRWRVIS
jgi:hypothetical protein